MKTITLTDRVTLQQVSARRWEILVDGQVVFTTHKGEKGARFQGAFWVVRTSR